jgi:hypothetical protein
MIRTEELVGGLMRIWLMNNCPEFLMNNCPENGRYTMCDVFYGRKPNRQIIVRKKYPQYKQGDLVLVKPIRERGLIKTKIFEFDYNIYVILAKEGDKYRIKSLYNFVHEINKVKKQWFKPYELRAISPRQALKHLNSPPVWQYLRKQYGDIAGLEKVKEHLQSLL